MLKHVLLATALTCGATSLAFAQSPPSSPPTSSPTQTTPTMPGSPASRANTASAPATESTGDFNAQGQMAGSALIGAKIHNDKKETVGSVNDIYLDDGGKVQGVVVSVGGFLGVGAKAVAVKWDDIKFGKDGKSLMLTTGLTADELKAMPDYKTERQKPAAKTGSGG
jgi:sporulation protein YlmC with PRC-barrel domain